MLGRMSAVLRRWSDARPVTVSATTGFVVMSVGDGVSQLVVGNAASASEINLQRNLTSSSYNGLASPAFLRWYRLMDWAMPGTTLMTLVPKTVLSQIVTTGLNNPCFLLWCHHMEALVSNGLSQDWAAVRTRAIEHMRQSLPNLYGSSMLFWLPVTGANYALIPDHLKVLWVSSCSVLWGGFVSHVAHRRQQLEQEAAAR